MSTLVTSYNPTLAGSVDARAADSLTFPFTARPQAMTIYVKFQERGILRAAAGMWLMFLGNTGATAGYIGLRTLAGGVYLIQYNNGATSVISTLAAGPAIGQIDELCGTIAATGSVQLSQSIQGAAITTAAASNALVLVPAWGGGTARLCLTGLAAGNSDGAWALLSLVIVRGVHDMTAMRRYAATKP